MLKLRERAEIELFKSSMYVEGLCVLIRITDRRILTFGDRWKTRLLCAKFMRLPPIKRSTNAEINPEESFEYFIADIDYKRSALHPHEGEFRGGDDEPKERPNETL
jgi:hypothetical protein